MSRIVSRLAVICAVLIAVSSCNDSGLAPSRGLKGPMQSVSSSADLSQTIDALIHQIFPHGLANSASQRWGNITTKLSAGDPTTAQGQLAALVSWVQSKTGDINPPEGETKEHAAARLVLYMSTFTYHDPSDPPPTVPPVGSDAVVSVIDPTVETTVVTPLEHAAINFPANAVGQPSVLVIYEDAGDNWAPCHGPLDTTLCQYPHFYHFDIFPHVKLNTPARIGVCHVLTGPNAPLRDEEHDGRLRVAHDAPHDPAGYTPNGHVVEGIEILPLTDISDFLLCSHTEADARLNSHKGNSLADRSWRALDKLASAAGSLFVPKTAYAIDQGGGGLTLEFSTFEVVDPNSNDAPQDVTPPEITPVVTGTIYNGWYTSDVDVAWSVVDNESAITTPACATASVTTDTPGQTFTCTATSAGGTTTKSVTVKRDATPPVIDYTGNAGSYTVDQSVNITCAASDAMSGLASTTCENVSGDAYTFGLGSHTYSASARDNAGNSSSASATFSVSVTPASLCALTQRFSSSAAIAGALCAKLATYEASIARGSSTSAAGAIGAYINQVQAQTGKALTASKASILISLARAL